jgi:hypothetical protein
MRRTIDLDQVRVVQADNYKGNPRVYLEVADAQVLYSDPYQLARSESFRHCVGEDGTVNTESLADMFRFQLASMLADALLTHYPDLASAWSRNTDREIDYVKPRLEEDRDD